MIEVRVERGPVVELDHKMAAASRHQHRFTDAPSAVPHTDSERCVGCNARRDDGIGENSIVVHLERGDHLQVVTRASADERA